MSRLRIFIAAAVIILVGGGVAVWWFVLRDTAAPEASIDAVGGGAAAADGSGSSASPSSPDGTWKVKTDDADKDNVFVGYRVEEHFVGDVVKKTATGRTPAVDGTITVDGTDITATTFTADLTQLKSDQARRDSSLQDRGLETGKFPDAKFELTGPVTLPAKPQKGKTVDLTATGDLTLHGVTKPIDLTLQARWDGSTISVAGHAPIAFADFGMDKIEIPGFVTTDDHGTLELQLLFAPS
jgi:polyisoprenoid-binding protein YceI